MLANLSSQELNATIKMFLVIFPFGDVRPAPYALEMWMSVSTYTFIFLRRCQFTFRTKLIYHPEMDSSLTISVLFSNFV